MDFGFPEMTESFLNGQDVLYSQFNEIDFYVEDAEQENFYFNILKNLFSNVKFEKIFPLGGKKQVKDAAQLTQTNNKKVYILDLDFDKIINSTLSLPNLFYLEKYSIENYLIDEQAIHEVIKDDQPKIKSSDIISQFNLKSFLDETISLIKEIACSFLLIQKYSLGENYLKFDPGRDIDYSSSPIAWKSNCAAEYLNKIRRTLQEKKPRMKFNSQINRIKPLFNKTEKALDHIPGKYLLNILKVKIEKLFKLKNMTLDSFSYRLAKYKDYSDLLFLRERIEAFVK